MGQDHIITYLQPKEKNRSAFMLCGRCDDFRRRLLEKQPDDRNRHFATENIIETLKNVEVANLEDIYKTVIFSKTDFHTIVSVQSFRKCV